MRTHILCTNASNTSNLMSPRALSWFTWATRPQHHTTHRYLTSSRLYSERNTCRKTEISSIICTLTVDWLLFILLRGSARRVTTSCSPSTSIATPFVPHSGARAWKSFRRQNNRWTKHCVVRKSRIRNVATIFR